MLWLMRGHLISHGTINRVLVIPANLGIREIAPHDMRSLIENRERLIRIPEIIHFVLQFGNAFDKKTFHAFNFLHLLFQFLDSVLFWHTGKLTLHKIIIPRVVFFSQKLRGTSGTIRELKLIFWSPRYSEVFF